jgi:hypothetical protein
VDLHFVKVPETFISSYTNGLFDCTYVRFSAPSEFPVIALKGSLGLFGPFGPLGPLGLHGQL